LFAPDSETVVLHLTPEEYEGYEEYKQYQAARGQEPPLAEAA
jgi:hypothetical protein